MRKLTVKNFSVIKDAELEFGKITVLIGPQSSGKSVLCRLTYFLGREVFNIAIGRVVNRFEYGFSDCETAVQEEFSKWFPRSGWGNSNWSIIFSANEYEVTISTPPDTELDEKPQVTFNEAFKSAYIGRIDATTKHIQNGGFIIAPAFQSQAATALLKTAGRGLSDKSIYIPVERSYLVDATKAYKILESETDPILAAFAPFYTRSLQAAKQGQRIPEFLKGKLESLPNGWMMSFHDGRYLPLNHLSSGSKGTLPILSTIDYFEQERRQSGNLLSEELYGDRLYFFDDFTIEEPESSVFPQTQYELVREFSAFANEVNFQPHFTITTHSPYILSAFGNLIKAGVVGSLDERRKEEVSKVLDNKYWIQPKDFAAYKIEDGKLVSIFDRTTGELDADYLDNVSGEIADEFSRLLELQYGE